MPNQSGSTVTRWMLARCSAYAGAVLSAVALASFAAVPGESVEAVLQRTSLAMGGEKLQSVAFSGSGSGATFGQGYLAGSVWPKITYSSFSRTADYENSSFREDAARSRAEANGGGAVPLMAASSAPAAF